jgi:hypothetical protein
VKINLYKYILSFVLVFILLAPLSVSAQRWGGGNRGGSGGSVADDCGSPDLVRTESGLCLPGDRDSDVTLTELIIRVINFLLGIAFVIAILFVVYGGYQYMVSGANPELAKKGRQTITHAVIGIAIIILSYLLVSVVSNTLSDCTGFFGGIVC